MITPRSATHAATAPGGLVVEVFHAEVDGCDPCSRAASEVDAAVSLVRDELAARGLALMVRPVPLNGPGHAQALGIVNPVTVRVAGADINAGDSGGQTAGCGGSHAAPKDCRSYDWEGETYDAPPAGLIVEAIHRHLDKAASG